MFTKLKEVKVFKDPIHGYIKVKDQIIWDLINTKEFQRLRRIRQLGGVYAVYHGAEHSRFSHSLGVYELARKSLRLVEGFRDKLSDYEVSVYLISALLHDVGHGPFSHAFETHTKMSHEEYTAKFITDNTEINRVLSKASKTLAQDVADVILKKNSSNKFIVSMLSSQVDIDRLDYMCRDSYYTGTSYGNIDYDRLFRVMKVDDRIYFKQSGIHAIEHYLLNRYQMYWQVYFHPVSRSLEILIGRIYKRIIDLSKKDHKFCINIDLMLKVLTNKNVKLDEYYKLDDYFVISSITQLAYDKDEVLSTLCKKYSSRDLFKYTFNFTDEMYNYIKENKDNDPIVDYFIDFDLVSREPYDIDKDSIFIKENGEYRDIKDVSSIVKGISTVETNIDKKLYYAKDLINKISDDKIKFYLEEKAVKND